MIQKYTVNLDDPPEDRWNHVIKARENELKSFAANLHNILVSQFSITFAYAWKVLRYIIRMNLPAEYTAELGGIVKACAPYGLERGDIVLLNLALDYMSRCTSAVVACQNGLYHFRTLDWALPELKALTCHIKFVKENRVIYEGITFVGMVGLLTGMAKHRFAISYNFRKTAMGRFWFPSVFRGREYSGVLIRQTLEEEPDFRSAVLRLRHTPLRCSCYITISGIQHLEGFVVVKDSGKRSRLRIMENCRLVQTNHDQSMETVDPKWANEDPILMTTIERQQFVENAIRKDRSPLSEHVSNVMQTYPVWNECTLFGGAMSAGLNYMSFDNLAPK